MRGRDVRSFGAARVFIGLSCGIAQAQSAGKMLKACQILQRGMRVEGRTVFLPPGVDARACWGFMIAVQQYASLADQNGKTLLNSCPPPDVKLSAIVGIFVSYAESNPDKLGLKAAADDGRLSLQVAWPHSDQIGNVSGRAV